MRNPRALADELEKNPVPPKGGGERFAGYGVLGLPFSSGHILAFRRMPASSIGPGYTTLWHRSPMGSWTFFTDADPVLSCPRYFGKGVDEVIVCDIELGWDGPYDLSLRVPGSGIQWGIRLSSDFRTRALSTFGWLAPRWIWRNRRVMAPLGPLAGRFLDLGRLSLVGSVPNGQTFRAAPRLLWRVEASAALVAREDLGPIKAHREQAKLGDLWIPNGGVFGLGEARFSPLDPSGPSSSVKRGGGGGDGDAPAPPVEETGREGFPGVLRRTG